MGVTEAAGIKVKFKLKALLVLVQVAIVYWGTIVGCVTTVTCTKDVNVATVFKLVVPVT